MKYRLYRDQRVGGCCTSRKVCTDGKDEWGISLRWRPRGNPRTVFYPPPPETIPPAQILILPFYLSSPQVARPCHLDLPIRWFFFWLWRFLLEGLIVLSSRQFSLLIRWHTFLCGAQPLFRLSNFRQSRQHTPLIFPLKLLAYYGLAGS